MNSHVGSHKHYLVIPSSRELNIHQFAGFNDYLFLNKISKRAMVWVAARGLADKRGHLRVCDLLGEVNMLIFREDELELLVGRVGWGCYHRVPQWVS